MEMGFSGNEESSILPKDEDLHGAALALVRLQDVYHLNMSNLARGNVWGIQSAAGESKFYQIYYILPSRRYTISYLSTFTNSIINYHAIEWKKI